MRSRDLGEVFLLWFSLAPVHRQVGAPPAALFSKIPARLLRVTPRLEGLAAFIYVTFVQKAMVPKSRWASLGSAFFGDARNSEEGGTTSARSSTVLAAGCAISRLLFCCPDSCTAPSRGALALPATGRDIKEGRGRRCVDWSLLLALGLRFLLGKEKKKV